MTKSKVYLVGAGPGDPGLITENGIRALKEADVVIYDFLANAELLAHAPKRAECLYVGKKGLTRHISQESITRLIIKHAKAGKTVVRLKGGDPFIFGRGGEEALALVEKSIPFEIIPGVTSAIAVPAYAGIPLTHRDFSSSVTFLTGHESEKKGKNAVNWKGLAKSDNTLVILMGWKNLKITAKKLIAGGRDKDTPVALVRWGTTTRQRCVTGTLKEIVRLAKDSDIKPPMITVVGDIVRLREKLNWFEARPLFGRSVLVTRTREQASTLTKQLETLGAETTAVAMIKTTPISDKKDIDRAIGRLPKYDWAIFTSANSVKYFFERLYKLGLDVRALHKIKIAAIGTATEAAIREYRLNVDLVAKDSTAEGLIQALGKRQINGKRFFMPRALKAREVIPTEIKALGGKIDVVAVYKTTRPRNATTDIRRILKDSEVNTITFTSSSTVTNFLKAFKNKGEVSRLLKDVTIACIGPITKKTAEDGGLKVDVMPAKSKDYTTAALTEALTEHFKVTPNTKEL